MHAFVVLSVIFPFQANRLVWGMSPKRPMLCLVGCKTLTQSMIKNQPDRTASECMACAFTLCGLEQSTARAKILRPGPIRFRPGLARFPFHIFGTSRLVKERARPGPVASAGGSGDIINLSFWLNRHALCGVVDNWRLIFSCVCNLSPLVHLLHSNFIYCSLHYQTYNMHVHGL